MLNHASGQADFSYDIADDGAGLPARVAIFAEDEGLRRQIGGISERMLAQTLQWLEEDGLVLRIAFDVVPPHVEYSLTPMGAEAAEKVRALADWVETAMPRVTQAWQSKGKIPV